MIRFFRSPTLFGRRSGKGEGDEAAAGGTTGFPASGGYHDKLAAIYHIHAGRGIASKRQLGLPEDGTRPLIKRPERFVRGGADKNKAARRHDRSAVVLCAGWREPASF